MRTTKRGALEPDGADAPIYLTAEGLTRLKEHLGRLKRAMPGYIEEAKRTGDFGDRSDNAEYKEAKGTLRRTKWKILSIEEQLKRVSLIPSGPNTSGMVRLGSTVVLEINGMRTTFQILGSQETDPAKGRISNQSAIGAALMGHKEGDTITAETASGPKTYRIIEVR